MQQPSIILSVSEITQAIKSQLEPIFRHVWVRGEITNYRLQSSGHHYFSLMDNGAQLCAVMFRGAAASLSSPIKNGDTVIAEGEISVYAPRGGYQLVVRQLMQVGIGEALLKLKALKEKLQRLGWFKPERKRPLPSDIRTIGLVTSPSGAVLHDIINILTRRLGGFHLIVNPVRVQGEGAALQVARAIQEFNAHSLVDVIIICRGGGSSEDLAAFNEEIVAAACFESSIPIISAIGHETDLSIADLVADLRAPTPSAAAELVSHERSEQREKLFMISNSALKSIQQRLRATSYTLKTFIKRCDQSSPQKNIEFYSQRLDDQSTGLAETMRQLLNSKQRLVSQMARALRQQAPTTKLAEQRVRLASLEKEVMKKMPLIINTKKAVFNHQSSSIDQRMGYHLMSGKRRYAARDWQKEISSTITRRLSHARQKLSALASNLEALNPQRTLERGYAIIFRENSNQVIRSVQMVQTGEPMTIMVADGTIFATAQQTQVKSVTSK
jgi:exodeoxyribonuclease VII large subunit